MLEIGDLANEALVERYLGCRTISVCDMEVGKAVELPLPAKGSRDTFPGRIFSLRGIIGR